MIYCYTLGKKVEMVNTSDEDAVKMHIKGILIELDSIADVMKYYREISSRTNDDEIAKSMQFWQIEANKLRANLDELKKYAPSSEPNQN